MFDGLKDKLNSFTEDVEEEAEDVETDIESEAVETEPEGAEAETEIDSEVPDGDTTESLGQGESVDTEGGDAAEQQAATAAQSGEEVETETTSAASVADSEGAEEEEPDDAGSDDEREESDDRSLTERAKLFASGKTVIDEDDLDAHLDELEFELLGSDVEMTVAQEILENVKANLTGETRRRLESTGNLIQDALREALYDVISVGQFDFDERIAEAEKPFVIIFTGVNGVGKTTTIAKLSRYFENQGHSSVLANGDTFRAGANEQLEQHARNLDKKIISHEQGSDPTAVIYDAVEYAEANDVDVVLGDTAGRLHTDSGLMDQLEKIDRVIDPDMTVFVDEAVAGQDAVNRATEFNNASDIDGTVLTKADADSQGGAAISVAHVTGKPILFLGTGQEYDDLERFDPERIVNDLLGEE